MNIKITDSVEEITYTFTQNSNVLDLQAITTGGTANTHQGSNAMFFISQITSISSLSVIEFFFESILHSEIC